MGDGYAIDDTTIIPQARVTVKWEIQGSDLVSDSQTR